MQAKYWKNICKMQSGQTQKGINKYGQILEDNTSMTTKERLEYLQEELIDALMYIEHIKANNNAQKQIPKKPKNLRFTPDGFIHWNCAQCGESNRYEYTINYCNMCGQRIDWSEVE